jgi:hypothetical protein
LKFAFRALLGLATALAIAALAVAWTPAAGQPRAQTTTDCVAAFVRGQGADLVWAEETPVTDIYTVVINSPTETVLARLLNGIVARHDARRHEHVWIGIFDDYQVAMHVARVQSGNVAADWEVANLDGHWVGEYSSDYLFSSGVVGPFAWESPQGKAAARGLTLKVFAAKSCS